MCLESVHASAIRYGGVKERFCDCVTEVSKKADKKKMSIDWASIRLDFFSKVELRTTMDIEFRHYYVKKKTLTTLVKLQCKVFTRD